jgi:hypothetical protein
MYCRIEYEIDLFNSYLIHDTLFDSKKLQCILFLTIFPVLVIRRTAGDWTNFGIQFVTGTSDVISSVSFGGEGKHLQHARLNDVRILAVVTVTYQQ